MDSFAMHQGFRKFGFPIALILALGIAVFVLLQGNTLQKLLNKLELITYDLRMQINLGEAAPFKPNPNIVLAVYDNTTIGLYRSKYGRWPWSRNIQGKINRFILDSGAMFVANDIVFPHYATDTVEDNAELIQAFLKSDQLYVGSYFDTNRQLLKKFDQDITPEDIQLLAPYEITLNSQLPVGSKADARFFGALTFDNFEVIQRQLYQAKDRILFLNALSDEDGVTRGAPMLLRFFYDTPHRSQATPFQKEPNASHYVDQEGKKVSQEGDFLDEQGNLLRKWHVWHFPHMALKLLMDLKMPDSAALSVTLTKDLQLRAVQKQIPMTPEGRFLLNWYHPIPGSLYPYPTVKIAEIIRAIEHQEVGALTEEDKQLQGFLKEKMVFVGLTAVPLYDVKTSPIDRITPGLVMQATTFDNLYDRETFITRVSRFLQTSITGLLCLLGALLIIRIRRAMVIVSMILVLALCYVGVAIYLFKFHLIWMDVAFPILAMALTMTLGFITKYVRRDEEYQVTYKLATTDGLTGLFNHRFFQEEMSRTMDRAKRQKQKFSLLLVDIDFFKKFNDTYGHQAGDQVLIQVAQTLKQTVRISDFVARYGGEEMAIVLDDTDEEGAWIAAQKLVDAIAEQPYEIAKDVAKHVTISVGMATYPTHGETIPALIEFSDQGLYRAKEGGRNQVGSVPGFTPPGQNE